MFNAGSKYCQDPKGLAEIVRFESSPGDAFAVADLTDAYRDHAEHVQRGYRLFAGRTALLVQDEFTAKQKSDVWWFAHGAKDTGYSINELGTTVTLRRGEKVCRAELLAPPNARFLVMDADPLSTSPNPSIQNPNDGIKKLAIHLPRAKQATIAVLFAPQQAEDVSAEIRTNLSPLRDWELAAQE